MSTWSEGRPVAVVTGGTSGLGRATVEALLEESVDVIAIGRDPTRCAAAEEDLSNTRSGAEVRYLVCDLSSTASVRSGASDVRQALAEMGHTGLDALINNAALVSTWRVTNEEGYEQQFAVNHLAPFVLTRELSPMLAAGCPGRVILVSSGSHRHGSVRWDDLMLTRGYSMLRAYAQSKLANVLFCVEFNRRSPAGRRSRAYAYDPGLMRTDIGLKGTGSLERVVWKMRSRSRSAIEPARSARHLATLAMQPQLPEPERIYRYLGRPSKAAPRALDPTAAERLWMVSERLCTSSAGEDG